jgi:hypothetical protein
MNCTNEFRTKIPPMVVMYHRFHLGQFCETYQGVEKGGGVRDKQESASYQRILGVIGAKRYEPRVMLLIYGMRECAVHVLVCSLGGCGGRRLARGSFG